MTIKEQVELLFGYIMNMFLLILVVTCLINQSRKPLVRLTEQVDVKIVIAYRKYQRNSTGQGHLPEIMISANEITVDDHSQGPRYRDTFQKWNDLYYRKP
jgi:hypothetical protein